MENVSLQYKKFGKPSDVVQLVQSELRLLKMNEIKIAMNRVSVNPSDLIPITGAYAHRTPLPAIVGYEGFGVVLETSSKSLDWLVGKRVLPLGGETWQKFLITQREQIIVLPSELSDNQACQIYINPLTAWVLCRQFMNLKKETVLLVNAANSAVGKLLLQFANLSGAKFLGVVRNEQARKQLYELGATHVINSSQENVFERVADLTNGEGVDYAIDSIGGYQGTILATCVKTAGSFYLLGLLSGQQIDWSCVAKLPIQTKIFHLRHWLEQATLSQKEQAFQKLFSMVTKRQLILASFDKVSPYTDFYKVLKNIEMKGVQGKQCMLFTT
ncbi:zinc-dependent alcohol dehydrogenase family protein [Enterococcus camelliae]|uniref:Zinc-dependent alcohol dehydrogenase family protein n=1 Tax=Enterococcus camelliae TaxID=453959 RepID=A0ABW5TJ71_9ENTE